jgi:exodeoxyribonuclease VII small subunit
MSRKSVTFEESMTRLDEIVKALEAGDVPLEESMKLFEEGTKLAAKCSALLDTAELKVSKLMVGPDGAPVEEVVSDDQLSS